MKTECIIFPALCLLIVGKSSLADSEIQTSPSSPQQSHQHSTVTVSNDAHLAEKRSVNPRDLMRYLLMTLHPNSAHYGRGSMGIPFRPVRRIGSEFLGKRSVGIPMRTSEEMDEYSSPDKRAVGSEFLGKRRLGSEFLGKRSYSEDNVEDEDYEGNQGLSGSMESWLQHQKQDHQPLQYQPEEMMMLLTNMEKRRLGSEFLGKRRNDLYDWSWKRGRLGSEFLGKRRMGSEFLGKRDGSSNVDGQQENQSSGGGGGLGPREMTAVSSDNIRHLPN